MRPQAIIWFERLYVASFVLGLLSTWQNWAVRERMLARSADTVDLAWLAPLSSALGVAIAVTLWYLVVRRGNTVAKWIVAILALWSVLLLAFVAFGLASARGAPLPLAIGAVQNILYIAAAAMLFRPDARAWFGELFASDASKS